MQGNLKDILSNLSRDIDQETLLKYLEGQLTEEQRHEVEKQMAAHELDEDALEGLEMIRDKQKLPLLVSQLKLELKKKLPYRVDASDKLRRRLQPWMLLLLVMLLVLIAIGYFIIYRLGQNAAQ